MKGFFPVRSGVKSGQVLGVCDAETFGKGSRLIDV